MLLRGIFAGVVFLSTAALADDFVSRVAAAERASSTPQGKKYDDSLGPAADAAIRTCVPPGSLSQAHRGKFKLVGYVADSGVISAVEVQPETEVSVCFAKHFAQTRFAPPPESGSSTSGFPITVEMSVLP